MAFWRHILTGSSRLSSSLSTNSNYAAGISNFSTKSSHYVVKVGIPEFLNGVGRGLENHVEKLEAEIGDFNKLLVTRTIKLKRLGIPCKDRKLILKYAHKYRLGLWRPRAEPVKS
ncbi:IGR motif protein [Perilla frutescens var. hirtella]|uniref:IGR motif protein n=1 Tax=Perilla frutescens var. hirtella TaxID=608512 RepID=A0AAD4JFS0_PERFH|nr:IGR motif protein [Perilla frutescens var. frutescens]KAH6833024.1 IGR motif protein [Perilla frutescens var. hirtella]